MPPIKIYFGSVRATATVVSSKDAAPAELGPNLMTGTFKYAVNGLIVGKLRISKNKKGALTFKWSE